MMTSRERARQFARILHRAFDRATQGQAGHYFDAEGVASFLIEGSDLAISDFPYEVSSGLLSPPIDLDGCARCEWPQQDHPSGPGWHHYVEPSHDIRAQRRAANVPSREVTDSDISWLAEWLIEANLNATDGQRIPDEIAYATAREVSLLLPQRSVAVILAHVASTE